MRQAEGAVVHGHHPARIQVQEGTRSVRGTGMNISKLGRIVSPNGKQCELWGEAHTNFAKTREVRRITRVINRVTAVAQNVATIAAMCIAQDASSPVS